MEDVQKPRNKQAAQRARMNKRIEVEQKLPEEIEELKDELKQQIDEINHIFSSFDQKVKKNVNSKCLESIITDLS